MAKNQQQQNNIKEQIFETVTTIVDESVKDLGYNITKICEVINVDEAEWFKYKVKCGSLEMNVVDDNKTDPKYSIGDIVRVTIPNGNYNAKKVIEGLYEVGSEEKTIYVEPKNHFVPMTDIFLIEPKKHFKLIEFNQNDQWEKVGHFTNLPIIGANENEYFNSIYLKFKISYLNNVNKNILNGFYTILMKIYLNDKVIEKKYSSTDIIGDPYNNLSMPQDVMFTFEDGLQGLKSISFSFQSKDFKIDNNNKDNYLTIDYIQLQLGHEYIGQEGLKLFTFDSLEYGDLKNDNQKKMRLIWYQKDENDNFIGFSNFTKNQLFIPKDLKLAAQEKSMLDIINNDKNNIYPKDEVGLKFVLLWTQIDKIIAQLKTEVLDIQVLLENLYDDFLTIYNWRDYPKEDEEGNTQKMLYWLSKLEDSGIIPALWMGWASQWNWFSSKNFPTIDKNVSGNFKHVPGLYAPRIDRTDTKVDFEAFYYASTGDPTSTLSYKKTSGPKSNYHFWLCNGKNVREGTGKILALGKNNQLPGEILNGFFAQSVAPYSEDSRNVLTSMGGLYNSLSEEYYSGTGFSILYKLKRYLIEREKKAGFYTYQKDGITYIKLGDMDLRWEDMSRSLMGRLEWKNLAQVVKDMNNIVIPTHNRAVQQYSKWENNLQNISEAAKTETKFFLNTYISALETYHNWVNQYIQAAWEKQNKNDFVLSDDLNPDDIKMPAGEISWINNGINIEQLFSDIASLANDLNQPLIKQKDTPFNSELQYFYDHFINPILRKKESITNLVSKINGYGYVSTNNADDDDAGIKQLLIEYYEKIIPGKKEEQWEIIQSDKLQEMNFSIYLLQKVNGETNLITNEKDWKLVENINNLENLNDSIENLLPILDNDLLKYEKVKYQPFTVNLTEHISQQSSTSFKIVMFVKDEKIESNILTFNNLINLNLFSISPHIHLQWNLDENYALVETKPTGKIKFNIQCYADTLEQAPITCYNYDLHSSLPALQIISEDVFGSMSGNLSEQYLNYQLNLNSENKVESLTVDINPEKKGAVLPTSPLTLAIRLYLANGEIETGFFSIPIASHEKLFCVGPKILIFHDNMVYKDSDEKYKLFLSNNNIDIELKTKSIQINGYRRENLFSTPAINTLLEIDENQKLNILNSNYNKFYPYLFSIKIQAEDNDGIEYTYHQPLLYFNQERYENSWGRMNVDTAFESIQNNILIDYVDSYTQEIITDEEIADLIVPDLDSTSYSLKSRNKSLVAPVASSQPNQIIEKQEETKILGQTRILPQFPYFQFSSDVEGNRIIINPEQEIPFSLNKDNSGIEFYYDGTIKFLKDNFEPILINYNTLTDGTLGIQIQQIGVIQDDEIISTCN